MSINRRSMLRLAGPALALPVVGKSVAADNSVLVSKKEIVDAFKFSSGIVRAESFNRRFELLINLFFESDPQKIRGLLNSLQEFEAGIGEQEKNNSAI